MSPKIGSGGPIGIVSQWLGTPFLWEDAATPLAAVDVTLGKELLRRILHGPLLTTDATLNILYMTILTC